MIKILIFFFLFILNILNVVNADTVVLYGGEYSVNSTVTNTSLNGKFNNIINWANGGVANDNIKSGYRLFEILGSRPAAGTQGRIVYNTTENSLHFDTGSTWYTVVGFLGTPVQGDIIYHDGTSWKSLVKGSTNQFLKTGTTPSWNYVTGSDFNVTSQTNQDLLLFDGTNWVRLAKTTGNASYIGNQLFTSDGNFTAPTGVTKVYVTLCGGGGGGGKTGSGHEGGGGGGASSIIRYPYTVVAGSKYNITVGAAGTGGVYGGAASADGGNTAFVNLYVNYGVKGTDDSDVGAGGAGGAGGFAAPSGGAAGGPKFAGGAGAAGDNGVNGGGGGACPFGTGGAGGTGASHNGVDATGYGAGGGGAHDTLGSGGNGTQGFCFVEW